MRTVIFDVDGTIADCSHRLTLAKSKEWDTFHSLSKDDPVIAPVADLLMTISQVCHVLLLTGMNEKYRLIRQNWLELAGLDGFYDELIMRPDNDWRQDGELKIALLEDRFGTKEGVLENVWFVVDDRDSVVEAMRNYGLTVLQPAVGGY